jgi:protein tyrosine phosphatase
MTNSINRSSLLSYQELQTDPVHQLKQAVEKNLAIFEEIDPHKLYRELEAETEKLELLDYSRMLDSSEVENAFDNVKCLKMDAVKVGDGFLHANRILGKDGYTHIAAQAPQSAKSREKFWYTAFHTEGNLIIDLTNEGDLAFPPKGSPAIKLNYPKMGDEPVDFGSMNVRCISSTAEEKITISKYEVLNLGNASSTIVTRINYQGWEDHSGTSAEKLKDLLSLVDKHAKKETIPIVHCRAGVGRTGTFITARTLKHLAETSNEDGSPQVTRDNVEEQMREIILNGRKRRGPMFVQREEQMWTLVEFAENLIEPNEGNV